MRESGCYISETELRGKEEISEEQSVMRGIISSLEIVKDSIGKSIKAML